MTTNYHTAITTGAAANAATINAPLSTLDTQVTAVTSEVTTARNAYASLDARLDAFALAGSNTATLANGVSAAGQKVLTVDSTTGFLAGAYVVYYLNGTTLEVNTIDTIQAGVSLTLTTNIGTGGVLNDSYVSMISVTEYLAAQAIPHAGTLVLPDTMEYANRAVFNAAAYGASPDADAATNVAAIQAAIDAAAVSGGRVFLPVGDYEINGTIDIYTGVTFGGEFHRPDYGPRLRPTTDTFPAIRASGPQIFWRIENLSIVPTAQAVDSGSCGILLEDDAGSPYWFEIERVNITGTYRGIHADSLTTQQVSIRSVWINTTTEWGIYWNVTNGAVITFDKVYVQSGAGGFYMANTARLNMINCASDSITSTTYVNLFTSCSGAITNWWQENCTLDTLGTALMKFEDSRMVVVGVTFYNNTFDAGAGNYCYIIQNATDTARNRVTLINCETDSNTHTSGVLYAIGTLGGHTKTIDCSFTLPAGGTGQVYGTGGQIQQWDTAAAAGAFQAFTAQDATPSVANGNLFKTANATATTITMFDDGIAGQTIKVVVNDALTTVDFTGGNLKGNSGLDWSPASGDWLEATFDGTDWYCTVSTSGDRATNLADAAGAIESGKCTAIEKGSGAVHQTELTFTLTGANDIDLADGADHGAGVKVYTFPAGRINVLGATINGVTTIAGASGGGATMPMAVGTVTAADDGTLTSTEANIIPSTAIANGASTFKAALAASAQFDGTTTAVALFVNAAVTDAISASDVTVALTGTMTITWINLGDY